MPAGSLSALAALALSTSGGGVSGLSAQDTERYLRLCLGRSFGRTVFATLDQRDPTRNEGRIQVNIVRDSRGRMKTSIVAPASLRGNEILDDGRFISVLLGKEKLVMIQESPAITEGDLETRIALVKRNYRVSVSPGPKTLGRSTVVLDVKARWRGIQSRRYLLDAAVGYPLRQDTISESGTENLFRALAVRYDSRTPRESFRPFSTEGRQVVRYAGVGALRPGEARRRVGFDLVVPRELPFGFRVIHTGINDTPDWRSVVVRLSDGLITSSVYLWVADPSDSELKNTSGRSIASRRGRTVMVVDGPALVRARLLDVFLDTVP